MADIAYDHITESSLPEDASSSANNPSEADSSSSSHTNLNAEFQEAFRAVSSSPWGATLGGWFSQARKSGESFYQDLQKEATEAGEQASKGISSLVSRTRGLSLNLGSGPVPGEEALPAEQGGNAANATASANAVEKPESLPVDIVKEAGSLVASLRTLGAAKLKDLQRAEDAADEALLRFGTNVRNFLRDAVIVTAPEGEEGSKEVMFETQEPGTGRKIFHSTRLDAQLHAIHMNPDSFLEDPEGKEEWLRWKEAFEVEKMTDTIASDLERYDDMRRAMEMLVPERVEYRLFWMRYYFLRKAIEEEERKRKEVLKGATAPTAEEVGWDDEDDEEDKASTPQPHAHASASTTTLHAAPATSGLLKPGERRRSEDENKSVADSDASYDLISGATSRAMGSPKDKVKDEESDDDWE